MRHGLGEPIGEQLFLVKPGLLLRVLFGQDQSGERKNHRHTANDLRNSGPRLVLLFKPDHIICGLQSSHLSLRNELDDQHKQHNGDNNSDHHMDTQSH